MKSKGDNQEILDDAPEGATHVDFGDYYMISDEPPYQDKFWYVSEWVDITHPHVCNPRSLVDIRRIVELENFIRRYRYNIKQNEGDGTQATISKLLGDKS